MLEQENYKKMLMKLIDATETKKIQTSEELIQALVNELTNHRDNFKTQQN